VATLRVWAPAARRVDLVTGNGRRPMSAAPGGWWEVVAPELSPGSDYAFSLDGGEPLPDPRSGWQPHGVLGPSRIVDPASFQWTDDTWRGAPFAGQVMYELHVGTFTPEGTFAAAAAKLDHLAELGVATVELMPVAEFDGPRGWGYDGAALYAVHDAYGGPDGLHRFVDAAHARGLAVCLDVVYNHLGPAGNVLQRFGPYFTDRHGTPWGPAVNLDGPGSDEVRRFIIDGALAWIRDYHVDGLRLDAVHAFLDTRATHLLEELAAEVHTTAAQLGRSVFVVAESDLNDPRIVLPREAGGYGLDGQWCDDVHHAIHAALTGERQGYYVDFGSLETLAKAMTNGFVHDGTYSSFRGRHHGRPVDRTTLSGHRFVVYTQTHDQVGNRAAGERLGALISPALLEVAAALVLTGPFTPMLFMGEEWGASTPWQFFTSFTDSALGAQVRAGRRQEFADHGWSGEVPDPQDPQTAERSTLDWRELAGEPHHRLLEWYRRLIAARTDLPELADGRLDRVGCDYDEEERWFVVYRTDLAVVCNLGSERRAIPVDGTPTEVLLASAAGFVYRDGVVETDGESVVLVRLAARE
jgi:maltooligosyltrehalose trehalohydrolase